MLEISPDSSAQWSLGRPGSRASGFQLNSTSGSFPFSHFLVSPTELAFRTGFEPSAPATFTVTLYVESNTGTEILSLLADITPGIQINATIDGLTSSMSSGNIALPLFE